MCPGPNIAVRVEFMARHVPSQARNVTHDPLFTLLSHSHLSLIACISVNTPPLSPCISPVFPLYLHCIYVSAQLDTCNFRFCPHEPARSDSPTDTYTPTWSLVQQWSDRVVRRADRSDTVGPTAISVSQTTGTILCNCLRLSSTKRTVRQQSDSSPTVGQFPIGSDSA